MHRMTRAYCCCYFLAASCFNSGTTRASAFVLFHPSTTIATRRALLSHYHTTTPRFNSFQRRMSTESTNNEMTDAATASSSKIASNLAAVQERIRTACQKADRDPSTVRLVAVSKTKPVADLQDAYAAGCRIFGENYVQELVEKAPQLSDTISWHYIGALQSNKAATLVKAVAPVHRLTVETVSSMKLANKLNKAVEQLDGTKLIIFIQVNTSGEASKSGVEPGKATVELCRNIFESCSHLELKGLMAIGAPGDLSSFETLRACRDEVADALQKPPESLELSMGMSGDFEEAIAAGSTNVRVGSTIFGARDYSNKK